MCVYIILLIVNKFRVLYYVFFRLILSCGGVIVYCVSTHNRVLRQQYYEMLSLKTIVYYVTWQAKKGPSYSGLYCKLWLIL